MGAVMFAAKDLDLKPTVIYDFGHGIVITDTMIFCAVLVLALCIFAVIVGCVLVPKWSKDLTKTTKFESVLCGFFGMVNNSADNVLGHHVGSAVAPYYFTIAIFMFFGVMCEFIGFRSVLTDLNCAIVLAMFTFFIINFYGFKLKKLKRFKRWANPIVFVTDSVVPVSMSLRMFGSVVSGFIIMHLLYGLKGDAPFGSWMALADVGLPAIASLIFTVFHALIQTYVFMMLSFSFISEAAE